MGFEVLGVSLEIMFLITLIMIRKCDLSKIYLYEVPFSLLGKIVTFFKWQHTNNSV